jgi:hypothetical protein
MKKEKQVRQKDISMEKDVDVDDVKIEDPRTVIHLAWNTEHIHLATTQDGLDAAEKKEPGERTQWVKERMEIVDGSAEWKEIQKEVEDLYKAIFFRKQLRTVTSEQA